MVSRHMELVHQAFTPSEDLPGELDGHGTKVSISLSHLAIVEQPHR